MKIYLMFLLLIGKSTAASTQEKVDSLEERVNTVARRTGSLERKMESIGNKMEQLMIIFQEYFGQTDMKKTVVGKEVVIVTGGVGSKYSVSKETGSVDKSTELYIPETGKSCFFKDLPNKRYGHTMDTVDNTAVVCGTGCSGKPSPTPHHPSHCPPPNCIQYTPSTAGGAWTNYGRTEGGTLQHHSSWVSKEGLVLMGGDKCTYIPGRNWCPSHESKSEIVPAGGRSFRLKQDIRQSCAISFDDFVIITGGVYWGINKTVSQYNLQGYVKNLPSLNQVRYDHGCGTYSTSGNKVMIVAGGKSDGHAPTSSTETMVIGDAAWKTVNPMPQSLSQVAFVSMGPHFLIIGGFNARASAIHEIYTFDGETWAETGKMKAPRYKAAATSVRSDELAKLCD